MPNKKKTPDFNVNFEVILLSYTKLTIVPLDPLASIVKYYRIQYKMQRKIVFAFTILAVIVACTAKFNYHRGACVKQNKEATKNLKLAPNPLVTPVEDLPKNFE